jgi:putative membrane protein
MKAFFHALLNAIFSVGLLAYIFPAINFVDLSTLVIAGIVLGLLQMFVRPVLKILFLPINIVTLGIFSWLINVFILWLATQLVPGFEIRPMLLLGYQLGEFGTLIVLTFMLSLAQSFVGIFL